MRHNSDHISRNEPETGAAPGKFVDQAWPEFSDGCGEYFSDAGRLRCVTPPCLHMLEEETWMRLGSLFRDVGPVGAGVGSSSLGLGVADDLGGGRALQNEICSLLFSFCHTRLRAGAGKSAWSLAHLIISPGHDAPSHPAMDMTGGR